MGRTVSLSLGILTADQEDELNKTWGGRIRLARIKADISQQGLADKVGVTQGCVSQWEINWSIPPKHMRQEVATVFHKTEDDLFDRLRLEATIKAREAIRAEAQARKAA